MYVESKKRYVVIFERWSERIFSQDLEYFDNMNGMKKHIDLINSIYGEEDGTDRFGNVIHTGFVVLDFLKEKILQWGKSERIWKFSKRMKPLELKDNFFRKDDEIPKDYKWDSGEYEGWLQYRWGDGKNAVGYKEVKKYNASKKCSVDNIGEEYDEQDKFDRQIEKEKLKIIQDRW